MEPDIKRRKLSHSDFKASKESSKSHNTSAERKNENSDEKETVDTEFIELNGKYLRRSFSTADGLDTLRKFITICKENKERDLAKEYLLAGGNILEVLRLLEGSDKKNINNATTVFASINILIMKILTQFPQNQPSTEEACRHLINSYLFYVHSMISAQSNEKQRKTILRLLTAIVSLGGTLPRELLTHLSLQPQVVESLVRHKSPIKSRSVRTNYIHFILAFLVDGNVSIIRTLLDKHDLLSSIFPNLMFDPYEIVNLVLTTTKKYILENSGISKTAKLHLFSTPIVQSLVSLYNWKGPKNWPKKNSSVISSEDYKEEKEIVTDIVHDFLLTLLTSHRYGIIFHDRTLGTSGEKHNKLLNSVLQSLDQPWEHKKPSDLVVNIMVACPDLIQSQIIYSEPFLEPRKSVKWLTVTKFVQKIIETINVDVWLERYSLELNAIQFSNAIKAILVPQKLIKNTIVPSLEHDNITVRHAGINLLMTIMDQIRRFLSVVEIHWYKTSESTSFKNSTKDIIKYMPNVNTILKVWSCTFLIKIDTEDSTENNHVPDVTKHDHLDAILDLLHAYSEVWPELLNTDLQVQPSILLTGLKELSGIDDDKLSTMKMKAIQFLYILDSSMFFPSKSIFKEALSFLIPYLYVKCSVLSEYARKTMKMLLNTSNVFEGCQEQINIWINSFSVIDEHHERTEVTNWFINVVKSATKHTEKYLNLIVQAQEAADTEIICASRVKDIFDNLCIEDQNTINPKSINNFHIQPFTSITPILCCALYKIKKSSSNAILCYVSHVLVHILHRQVVPGPLIHLSADISDLPIEMYLSSWSRNEPVCIKKVSSSMSVMSKLSEALLNDTKIQLSRVFHGNITLSFTYNNENITIGHKLSAYDTEELIRMCVFYLTYFTKQGTLNETKCENCKVTIVLLLHVVKSVTVDNNVELTLRCLKSIFTHPIILQYFSLCQKDNDIEKMITNVIIDICKIMMDIDKECDISEMLLPYKNKVLTQLTEMIETKARGEDTDSYKNIIMLLELLHFSVQDIEYLLDLLMKLEKDMYVSQDKSDLSVYGYILPKLLQLICMERMRSSCVLDKLDTRFIGKLCSYLMYLKSKQILYLDKWETALQEYLQCFPRYITGINSDLFVQFFINKIGDTTVKLISFLINKNPKYLSSFMKYAIKPQNKKQSMIIFPIIANNLKYAWKIDFLKKLNEYYQNEILRYITHPEDKISWIEDNVAAAIYIINNTFDLKTCKEVCDIVPQIEDKLDMVTENYLRVLQNMYMKYAKLQENYIVVLKELIQIFLYITTLTLKRESKNVRKLTILYEALYDTVYELKRKNNSFIFDNLSNHHSWPQFTRFSLKLALKLSKDNTVKSPVLKTLCQLCDVSYKDKSESEYVKTLFEMAASHSEFINIMLSSSLTKRDLIELLWILVRKNTSLMTSKHIPLFLAAYNGTLSESDQFILLILQHYESNNITFNEYRPFLWGNAAATHYSVKGEIDTVLWRQPTVSQVLNLFEERLVENTIKCYSVNRRLKNNELQDASDTYDPAFYLPLLCYLLSDNNIVACYKVTQSGALALAFLACSSIDDDVRMAGFTVISRYYFHLDASNSKDKLLWIRLIDSLRNGILVDNFDLKSVRLSCLLSTFLARTSLVATQPLHPLYLSLHTFLMAKPALNLNTIPELLQLFHSSDIKHETHRQWILENIRDGIKTENDVDIAFKCVLFKMLLDFFSCIMCDDRTKILILEVIYSTSKIEKSCLLLMNGYGLLSWLAEIVTHSSIYEEQFVILLINIAKNLYTALLHVTEKCSLYHCILLNILLTLKSRFPAITSELTFMDYLVLLTKLIKSRIPKKFVSKEHTINLIDFSKKFLGNVDEFEIVLNHDCEYMPNLNETDDPKTLRDILWIFICTWCKHVI